eukprot:CAMPEP_0179032210 /NCGR_PEP_ID=MMETSP0796-20121207/11465_1 /TAXON_ID=73915 /ORGANISM="Pyrodinium bahamense, Strain pbaha01" /LENGTH=665 /DNA_ID=CAMNT_0020728419 /DNA_START=45 /DNA_END=2042 /DNA_ORIENTATION=+
MTSNSKAAGRAVMTWLREREEAGMIRTFDESLVPRFGLEALRSHVDQGSKHQHGIAHELVKLGKMRVLVHLVENYDWDINRQRASDLNTPLHLALWQNQSPVAERLLQMRADASIQNKYGEDANAIRLKNKPIRARLQGVQTQIILQLVDSELEAFDSLDTITAYYNVAKMSADYDAEFSDWKGSAALERLTVDRSFQKLARTCTDVLCGASGPGSGAHWATMLRGLAMLPDRGVLEALARWVEANGLPLDGWDGEVLQEVAWGIAKLDKGSELWAQSYKVLGIQLSRCIGQMQERHIASAVWAFAKAGARASGPLLQHPELFQAVARFLEERGDSLSSPQTVSNIAWGFAKLGERHPRAFSALARAASQMMDDFADQNVANTAWAYARLGLAEEPLFCELMRRAGTTLYDDQYKNHVRMSRHVKMIHWAQIYEAYCFCGEQCPAAMASLSRRLVTDLQKIDVQDRSEGLSEGSGLECVERLRELDAMISELEDIEAAPSVPADSLEATIGAPLPPAQSPITVVVLKFSRSPESFRKALLEGLELKPCREALEASRLEAKLPEGAKIFVRPEHYEAVRTEVRRRGMQLHTSHVLVAEEFEGAVHQALAGLRSSEQVRARERCQLAAHAWEELGVEWNIRVKRTFLSVSVPPSVTSDGPTPHARSV